jgi:hypothetical protein
MRHLLGEGGDKPPNAPAWRQISANRRIGTHGWVVPGRSGPVTTLNVKVREDHIWATTPCVAWMTDGAGPAKRRGANQASRRLGRQ